MNEFLPQYINGISMIFWQKAYLSNKLPISPFYTTYHPILPLLPPFTTFTPFHNLLPFSPLSPVFTTRYHISHPIHPFSTPFTTIVTPFTTFTPFHHLAITPFFKGLMGLQWWKWWMGWMGWLLWWKVVKGDEWGDMKGGKRGEWSERHDVYCPCKIKPKFLPQFSNMPCWEQPLIWD